MNPIPENEVKMRGLTQMKISARASLIILAMLAMVAMVPAAHAQSTVGTITQVQGTANIQRNGATIAVVPNLPVMLHDRISTEANASLTISLVDNSSLQLGASSIITIDESVLVNGVGAPSKVGLLNGDLHTAILGAMRGSSTTFEVNTPNAIGAVRGTEWNEHYDTEDHHGCRKTTKVDVEDGTVQVCNTENPPVCKDIHQGQHTEVRCGAFWEGGGLGGLGAGALGIGLAAGAGVGIAAGAGAFNGPGGGPPPPASKSK
jgi:FecR protein